MAQYFYIAKNKRGENQTGQIEAADKHDLAIKLRDEELILISGKKIEQEKGKNYFNLKKIIRKFSRVSLVEKMVFSRNLALMIKSGLSINQALTALIEQTRSSKFKKIIKQIGIDINKGTAFSESLSKYPRIFNQLYTNMIQVGETSGNLEEILNNLAEQMEKDHRLLSRVRSALIYPSVIIAALIFITIFMMVTVIPKLTETFIELDVELPLTTRIIINLSGFLKDNFFSGALFLIILIISIKLLYKNEQIKKIFHKIYLLLPVVGDIVKKVNSARFAGTFSSLFKSGVPIVKSLRIVAGTLGNIHFKEALLSCAKEVQKGEELSKCLSRYKDIYSPMVIQMFQLGEETGSLSEVLKNLSDFYEEEIDTATKNLSSVIEPLIMIVIGLAVGFFAVSMIQPMYSIMGGL